MANDSGPSIKIPVDASGLKTLSDARAMAKLASGEVRMLQRDLEKAAKAGQTLDKGIQARLQSARTLQIQAEHAADQHKTRIKAAKDFERNAIRDIREKSGDRRQAFGAVRGLASGGFGGSTGDIRDVADIFKVLGLGGASLALERLALPIGIGVMGLKAGYDRYQQESASIADAHRMQVLAGAGKVGGWQAQVAQEQLGRGFFGGAWNSVAGEDASAIAKRIVSLAKMQPQKIIPSKRKDIAYRSDIYDRQTDPATGLPMGANLLPGDIGAANERRKKMKEDAELFERNYQNALVNARRMRESKIQGKRPWTQRDKDFIHEQALKDTGISGPAMERFKKGVQEYEDTRDNDEYGENYKHPKFAIPPAKRWDSLKREYYPSQSQGVFGQGGDEGAPGTSGDAGQAGPSGFDVTQMPTKTFLSPLAKKVEKKWHGIRILHDGTVIQTGNDDFASQNQMNHRQTHPLKEPLAAVAIMREQYPFGAGREIARTTDGVA